MIVRRLGLSALLATSFSVLDPAGEASRCATFLYWAWHMAAIVTESYWGYKKTLRSPFPEASWPTVIGTPGLPDFIMETCDIW